MTRLFCEPVTVSGGSGSGIGAATCTDNAGIGGQLLMIRTFHSVKANIVVTFLRQDLFHFCVQMNIHMIFMQFSLQGGDHIRRMIGYRKYPVAPLCFQGASRLFDQITHLRIVKAVKSTVQEFFIGADILEQHIHIRSIGHITTAFSRNKQLFPKLFIFFQKGYVMSAFCCRYGSHHAGSPAADHYHIAHSHPFLPTYQRHCSLRRRE